jgi:hypothetical protein
MGYENMTDNELLDELIERSAYARVEDVIRLYQSGDVIGAVKNLEVAFPELAGLSKHFGEV